MSKRTAHTLLVKIIIVRKQPTILIITFDDFTTQLIQEPQDVNCKSTKL